MAAVTKRKASFDLGAIHVVIKKRAKVLIFSEMIPGETAVSSGFDARRRVTQVEESDLHAVYPEAYGDVSRFVEHDSAGRLGPQRFGIQRDPAYDGLLVDPNRAGIAAHIVANAGNYISASATPGSD